MLIPFTPQPQHTPAPLTSSAPSTPVLSPSLPARTDYHDLWFYVEQWLTDVTRHEIEQFIGSYTGNLAWHGFIATAYASGNFGVRSAGSIGYRPAGTGAHTVTSNGGAFIDTSQSKFGGASGKFVASSSQYLSIPDSADWYFGTGDFTIDFWVRFNTLPGVSGEMDLYAQQTDGTHRLFFGLENVGGTYKWRVTSDDGGINIENATAISTGTWYHVALVRSSSSWYIFQAGTQIGTTYTGSGAIGDYSGALNIGRNPGGVYYLDGWLDEYRVSKAVARWTSNFTAPTAAYGSDSYTVLLLHMDGTNGSTTFIDDSAGADFSIGASPGSQSVGAGSTASYTLNLAASGGYTGTVTLTIASGCPSGVTCTITPSSVSSFPNNPTLSVPTLITTPSGTTAVTVTATDGTNTHTAQVSLTVVGPTSFNFNVKSSATQVVVTLMYSWTGSGAPPQGTITIAGPGGTPTLLENGAVVYD